MHRRPACPIVPSLRTAPISRVCRAIACAALACVAMACVPWVATAGTTPRAVAAAPATDDLRPVTVDAGSTVGELRSLAGVNGAPAPGVHKPEYFTFGGWNMPENVDASSGYRRAGIDLVRTHDAYGPGDIDARFETASAPGGALISAKRDVLTLFPNPEADPDDPKSYNFGPTDSLIASIVGVGARVLFRVGRSEGADPQPPRDFDRYAAIVRHIVLHYNSGWANGQHHAIADWEIWNEPDLGKLFWAGTPQQFFQLYAKLARAIKQADPRARVGGPAIARSNDDSPYQDEFLRYVHDEHVPLDFYSWHWYATDSNDPLDFVRVARDIRARLDKHGLQTTQSFLTEWNYGLAMPPPPPLVRGAFVTSALVYMQDAPIDAATLYRADNVFGADGATPDATGRALIALGEMKTTPVRLRVSGADLNGLAVVAGRSLDRRMVRILVSNYQIPAQFRGPRGNDDTLHVPPVFDVKLLPRRSVEYSHNAGVALTIDNLGPRHRYVVERCRISKAGGCTSANTVTDARGTLYIRSDLAPPDVELVTLRSSDAPP